MANGFRRIVVKIGTNSLMKRGSVDRSVIKSLARELSALHAFGHEVILVTSGAIGCGIKKFGAKFPEETKMRQAMAAVGQNLLMHEYEKAFRAHNQVIAQVLLTPETFTGEKSLSNLRNTIETLFRLGAVPIINENDAVSTEALSSEEIFSDNDGLAALLACGFSADLMVILTDVDGIFTSNPKEDASAGKINGTAMLAAAKISLGSKSEYGLGGVTSKILAVKKVTGAGVSAVVCRARPGAVIDVVSGNPTGSFFEGVKIPRGGING